MGTTHTTTPPSIKALEIPSDALFESMPMGLLLVDGVGRIVRANPIQCKMLGCSAEDLQGKLLWDFIADEDLQPTRQRLEEYLNGFEMTSSHRRKFKTRRNEHLICELTVRIMRNGSEPEPLLLLASVDITQLVSDACSRGEFLRWIEASYRCLPEATMILDALGHIRYLNHAAEKLLGWTEADATGERADDWIAWSAFLSSDGAPADYEFRTGVAQGWSGSATVVTRDGESKRVQIRTEPVVDLNGLVLGIACCFTPIASS